jgi:hypothetical protein
MTPTPQPRPTAATADRTAAGARLRMWSGISAALLLPAVVLAKVLLLMTEKGGRCFVQGCAPFPYEMFGGLLAAAAVSVAVTMAVPVRLRGAALALQLGLELTAVFFVLGHP